MVSSIGSSIILGGRKVCWGCGAMCGRDRRFERVGARRLYPFVTPSPQRERLAELGGKGAS